MSEPTTARLVVAEEEGNNYLGSLRVQAVQVQEENGKTRGSSFEQNLNGRQG